MTATDTGRSVMAQVRTSLRQSIARADTALAVAVIIVGTAALVAPLAWQRWFGGDLLYHSALTTAIVRGELPPGGPYRDLPAYYPPVFHLMVASLMAGLGLSFDVAIRILTVAWLPVLAFGTYALTRYLTGRPAVALLATGLTLFAGAFDYSNNRVWVNSLFMVGHAAAPVYPRDIVFALLPWAALALLIALEAAIGRRRRAWAWAVTSGVLFGIAVLTQLQLLLPLPVSVLLVGAVLAIRHRHAVWRIVAVLLIVGAIAFALLLPWLLPMASLIARNGGVALENSAMLVPLMIGFWDLPRQFGILLPSAIVGAGVALLFLRRPGGPEAATAYGRSWGPALAEGPLLLVPWMAIPFVLGLAYQPSWPLEDALRPQRLFLVAGQPMLILSAIGLVATTESLGVRWGRPRLIAIVLAVAVIASTIPVLGVTAYRAAVAWTEPAYAHLDLERDRVPDFVAIVPTSGPRSTVLTYEDWSALAWYETAAWIVAMEPPGYAKLAFDPEIFTGRSQEQRRLDILRGFTGDLTETVAVSTDYGAERIVLAKSGNLWGTFDQTARMIPIANALAVDGSWGVLEGNGWDALRLDAGSRVTLQTQLTGQLELALRAQSGSSDALSQLRLLAVDALGSERVLLDVPIGWAGGPDGWPIATWTGSVIRGEQLVVEAGGTLYLQSVRGYAPVAAPPDGWRIESDQPDYVVLARLTP